MNTLLKLDLLAIIPPTPTTVLGPNFASINELKATKKLMKAIAAEGTHEDVDGGTPNSLMC